MKTTKLEERRKEMQAILKVIERAQTLVPDFLKTRSYPQMDMLLDLEAVNSSGDGLDFEKLIKFDDFNFLHDILGIRKHINRETGELEDCFLPRCSKTPLTEEQMDEAFFNLIQEYDDFFDWREPSQEDMQEMSKVFLDDSDKWVDIRCYSREEKNAITKAIENLFDKYSYGGPETDLGVYDEPPFSIPTPQSEIPKR